MLCCQARHRTILLALSLLVWTLATGLTGFAESFGLVAVARVLQGLGEAGCTPFATAIIADFFPKNVLGTAISFYNVGIYTGGWRHGSRAWRTLPASHRCL